MAKIAGASAILWHLHRDDPGYEARVQEELAGLELSHMIAKMREGAGLTQQQVAERMGTKQSAIARLESGKHRKISVETLVKAASVTGHKLRIKATRI